VCRQHGIGSLCPTLVTASTEALLHGFRTLRRACETDSNLAHALPVIHLEGPYISPEDGPRGAHPRQQVRPPSLEEFQCLQEAAGGRIRLVTLAPEIEGAIAFIERLTGEGFVVAIGHMAATGALAARWSGVCQDHKSAQKARRAEQRKLPGKDAVASASPSPLRGSARQVGCCLQRRLDAPLLFPG
jgi:hypothetical protein